MSADMKQRNSQIPLRDIAPNDEKTGSLFIYQGIECKEPSRPPVHLPSPNPPIRITPECNIHP